MHQLSVLASRILTHQDDLMGHSSGMSQLLMPLVTLLYLCWLHIKCLPTPRVIILDTSRYLQFNIYSFTTSVPNHLKLDLVGGKTLEKLLTQKEECQDAWAETKSNLNPQQVNNALVSFKKLRHRHSHGTAVLYDMVLLQANIVKHYFIIYC